MLTIDQALEQLLAQAQPMSETETVSLPHGLGRVLAADIVSTIDVPPADNSSMDGYALAVDTLHTGHHQVPNDTDTCQLAISQVIAAGHPPTPLKKGTAARIFTGADIPVGANAVVMQEHCTVSEGDDNTKYDQYVTVPTDIALHNNIRPKGQDIQRGHTVLPQGRQLLPQDMGLLASIGLSQVLVYRRLRVAVLSSGDELVEPGQALGVGKIYNSNRYLLQGLLTHMGMEVVDIDTVEDNHDATVAALQSAAAADCILSTGGVSVGDEDHVKQAVSELGAIHFWRIAIKPGKPVAFGHITHANKKVPFIGLPGNPASVFTTFLLLARPFLLTQQHQANTTPTPTSLIANFTWKANPKRQEYLRARLNQNNTVDIYPNQSSGVLSSTSWAEGFAVIPPQTAVAKGDIITFIRFCEWL